MNAEIKAKWLEALRSGRYAQGRHYLRKNGGDGPRHCCLGVLCEVLSVPWIERDDGQVAFGIGHGACTAMLPVDVRLSVGLRSSLEAHLAAMNDQGRTFGQIADFIEASL